MPLALFLFFFLPENCVRYSFVIPYEFWDFLFCFCKKCVEDFDGDLHGIYGFL